MLSLLTLNKLIKLELSALRRINSHLYQASLASGRDENLVNLFNDFAKSLREYFQEEFGYSISELSTAIISRDFSVSHFLGSLGAEQPLPNPNRFIKSSFALSLLWTARFYAVLSDKRTNLRAYWSCLEAFGVMVFTLGYPINSLKQHFRNSVKWVLS